MTFTIDPFVAGIICTLLCEFIAFIVTIIVYAFKTHKNTSNFDRRDKNE